MAGPSQSLAPREIDHTTGDYIPYSVWTVCGFSNVPQNLYVQGLWRDAYSLLSLSEKARKMSLQMQHFLLSYFKTPNVDSTGVWTIGLPLGRLVLIQLSMSISRCSCFGIHITFIKLPPLVLLQPNNTDSMLVCTQGKNIELFKMLLFCFRLQVIHVHVSPFLHLHVDLIPFLTHSFN